MLADKIDRAHLDGAYGALYAEDGRAPPRALWWAAYPQAHTWPER